MKKTLLVAAVLLPACLFAVKIPDSVPKPTASLKNFDIDSISFRDINFAFDVEIKNPYPLPLKLDNVQLTFYIENKKLLSTQTAGGLKIKARKSAVNRFIVNLKYEDIIKIVKDYTKKDMLACRADIKLVIPLPDLPALPESISFDYSVNTSIPAIKPEISIANFEVRKPSPAEVENALKAAAGKANARDVADMLGGIFSGEKPSHVVDPSSLDLPVTVEFDIVLKNNTANKIAFNDLNYDFFVSDSSLVKGNTRDIKSVGNTCIVRVANKFSTKSLGKSLIKVFDDGKGLFEVRGSTFVKLPDSVKKSPLKLEFSEKGQFNTK